MKFRISELIVTPMIGVNAYRWREICLNDLELSKDNICLDIGCGNGHIEFLTSKFVKKVIGIDVSKTLINYHNGNLKPDNVEFYAIDVTKEIPNEFLNSFDKCICIDVMEHVGDPTKVLRFISSALKVGGELVMTFPINNSHHGRNYFTEDKVCKLFEYEDLKSDIKIIELGKLGLFAGRFYEFIRNLVKPAQEADMFDDAVCFSMMQKPREIYRLYKWGLILLCKISEGSYYEARSGNRVLIHATKVQTK